MSNDLKAFLNAGKVKKLDNMGMALGDKYINDLEPSAVNDMVFDLNNNSAYVGLSIDDKMEVLRIACGRTANHHVYEDYSDELRTELTTTHYKAADGFTYTGKLEDFLGTAQSSTQTAQSSAQTAQVFLDIDDVVELTGIKKRTLQDRCKKSVYETTTTTGRGGTRYLIALSSLPAEAQERYQEQQTAQLAKAGAEQAKKN